MKIDVHSHIMDPSLAKDMATAPHPNAFNVQRLLDQQEEAGIDLTVVNHPSVVERTFEKSPSLMLNVVKGYDDTIAALVQKHKGRLEACAVSYPFGGDPFLKEFERAIKDLGLKGVMINPRYGNEFLDSPRAAPFLELACKLDVPVYLHPPMETIGADYMRDYRLIEMIGRPNETTLGLARLIYAGVLQRLPKLKILASHLGGGIMMLPGRLNYGYECRDDISFAVWGPDNLKVTPLDYLKRIYVDSMSFHPPAIRCAIDTIGIDHVLMGSDNPPVMVPLKRTVDTIKALGLSAKDEKKILGDNAKKLFKL